MELDRTAKNFYPRSPCGERHCTSIGRPKRLYFYPRSPCGERHRPDFSSEVKTDFYPRSPCGERPVTRVARTPTTVISIHALLAESDYHILDDTSGATYHFYPRSPCGERPLFYNNLCQATRFLSTLSLRRATIISIVLLTPLTRFLSTLSLRRATAN